MDWKQKIGRVAWLQVVTGNNVELVLVRSTVGALGPAPSEKAVGHVHPPCTLVAVSQAILTDPVGLSTGSNHVFEVLLQKGVFPLTCVRAIIDLRHFSAASHPILSDVLDLKPLNGGDT